MAISEESRHHLYQRLEEVLGPAPAATLMEHLPPVGWADVATKQDLRGETDHLRASLADFRRSTEREFGHLGSGMEHFETRFDRLHAEFRTTMLAVMSMMVVLVAAMVAAVKL
jgi:hypothetical protein